MMQSTTSAHNPGTGSDRLVRQERDGTLTFLMWDKIYTATLGRDRNGSVTSVKLYFTDPIRKELGVDRKECQVDLVAIIEPKQGKDLLVFADQIERAHQTRTNPFNIIERLGENHGSIHYFSPRLGGFVLFSECTPVAVASRRESPNGLIDSLTRTIHFDYYQTKRGIERVQAQLGNQIVLLTIDISGLRKANEAGAGACADAFLAEVPQYITLGTINAASGAIRPRHLSSRSGGDEFKSMTALPDIKSPKSLVSCVEEFIRDYLQRKHFPRFDETSKKARGLYGEKYGSESDFMTAYIVATVFTLSSSSVDESRERLRAASREGDRALAELKKEIKGQKGNLSFLPAIVVQELSNFVVNDGDREHFETIDRFDTQRERYEEYKRNAPSLAERTYFDRMSLQAKVREPLEQICLLRLGRSGDIKPTDLAPGVDGKPLQFLDIDIKNFSFFNSLLSDQIADKKVVDEIFATELSVSCDSILVYRVSGGRFVALAQNALDQSAIESLSKNIERKLGLLLEAQDPNEVDRVSKTTPKEGAGTVGITAGLLSNRGSSLTLREIHDLIQAGMAQS